MPPSQAGDYIWVKATNSLTKFDLDFPGGTPKDLVKAIEKANGKPLNAIIPDDCANLKIPAVSVKNVTVAQLFDVLTRASTKFGHYLYKSTDGNAAYLDFTDSYGFRTEGIPDENSIWYLYWDKKSTPQQVLSPIICRFYQLGPYLNAGYRVEDVTTAIETSWKMLGDTKPPQISYHKDTKVLIAVGEAYKVDLIGDVLKQLSQGEPKENSAKGQAGKTKTE